MSEERSRILQMLAEGQISAEEAGRLLDALEGAGADPVPAGVQKPARLLRVYVNDPEGAEVKINLPLALARFALKFIPKEQQRQIAEAGFDIDELLSSLRSDMPEGKLVEIRDTDGTEILIEVV
ncbi:SHOCT-like domain-containing protein [Oceanithermus sp.]